MTLRTLAILATLLIALPAFAGQAEDDDYDRFDGRGKSGKKVHVVEWEGNLEIHVYPGGSLAGLAVKLDKQNEKKPVMIIGYRFDTDPGKQHVRRNILGISLREGFHVFRDPSSGAEYDKLIITNNVLADLRKFKLDAEPTQLYPDGHPALAQKKPSEERKPAANAEKKKTILEGGEDGAIRPFQW